MTKKLLIVPYKAGSKSAKALAGELGVKRMKIDGSSRAGNACLLNYGNGSISIPPQLTNSTAILNEVSKVAACANKLTTFQALIGAELGRLSMPSFVTSLSECREKLQTEEWKTAVARTKLAGHSGAGIVLVSDSTQLPDARLYVEYVKKKEEYRVHVFRGQVIDVQRKMRKSDVPDEEVNWQVRNLDGGFIYGREGVTLPDDVKAGCVAALQALELDFGAVDVIWNEHRNQYYFLEVNTAPGLTGTTLEKYADAVREWYQEVCDA